MAQPAKLVRIAFRLAVLVGICVLGFYLGRPLYWKLSATMQEIREKDYTQEAVKQGFSDLMAEAQKSVGWGPGPTINFEKERAMKRAQTSGVVDIATTKSKSKSGKQSGGGTQSVLSISGATKKDVKDRNLVELKVSRAQSRGKSTATRRSLLHEKISED